MKGGHKMSKETILSKEVQALAAVFQAATEPMTLAKAAELAGVPSKSGYLTALKKHFNLAVAGEVEVEVVAKRKVNTYQVK